MAGHKLHHFVCFAVTMGLVACDSGNLNSSPDANSGDTPLQNGAESAMEPAPPVNSTVNSTTTELDTTSSFEYSGPAPSNAVTPSNCPNVKLECKSCTTAELAEVKHQKALFLILSRALLFTCIVLLITVTALACKVSHLRGRLSGSRSAPINDAGLWGVAETSVMLEEVTPVQNEEETAAATKPGQGGSAGPPGRMSGTARPGL